MKMNVVWQSFPVDMYVSVINALTCARTVKMDSNPARYAEGICRVYCESTCEIEVSVVCKQQQQELSYW